MIKNFGETLRNIRKSRNMTLEDMAELLDTTKQALSRYERGERVPKITVAAKFAEKLGVDLKVLVNEDGKTTLDLQYFNAEPPDHMPQTPEAQAVSFGMDSLPQEKRELILNMVKAMFPETFNTSKGNNEDET